MNLVAEVIIPAFEAPYLAPLLFPLAGLAAIAVEVLVFWLLNKHLSATKIIAIVVAANVTSGVFGFVITAFLPTGLVPKVADAEKHFNIMEPGPLFRTYLLLSFLAAFVLSVLIEYAVVRRCEEWARTDRPFRTVTLANLAGYATLMAVAWFWALFPW
jgi:hypothetical protein